MKESFEKQGFNQCHKFELVIAVAKRSKQIAREAKAKGLSPAEVALVNSSKHIKPTTLALEEFLQGKLHFREGDNQKEKELLQTESPSEEPESPSSEISSSEE